MATGNPIVYNIIEFQNSEPDYDIFDISPCYSASEKIHFLLLINVLNPAEFSSVTPRVVKDRITEILSSLIRENNRFAGIQIDYDSGTNLYVYATLLERAPVDNTDIQHAHPHTMEAAFLFLGGSVRSQISSSITTPDGKSVTLIPTKLLRMDFAKDFTTPPSTTPQTTQTPPIPPRRTTPTSTLSTASTKVFTHRSSSLSTSHHKTALFSLPPMWQSCRPICFANNMCPCQSLSHPSPSLPASNVVKHCDCGRDCPMRPSGKNSQAGPCSHFSGRQGQAASSSTSDITVAALVGAMFGTLALGLILGFVGTRLYHVLKRLPDIRLVNSDDELKY
ncbi:hypothetical protein PoB_004436700 [Plakobranchus ocellatus]|uniref:SEA domain-containing protein n=1 Tax=Plakobranchus ocellatus TaxID=259542 RepID=A0AAV4BF69_9GAST|nr:hypothetical protein PoB_004436700 [Plakobranchus ocellatus]